MGLITYMRTDSLRISDEALSAAHDYIQRTYGANYALPKPRTFRSKSNAQDGHEAIRPTMIDLAPAKIKESLSSDQYKLYKLVWERFIASQMAACVQDTVSTDITAGEHLFKASGFSVRFDGYTRLYTEAVDNEEEQETNLPRLEEGEHLTLKEPEAQSALYPAAPRYTEATLIREPGGKRHRPPQHLRAHPFHHTAARLCGARGQGPKAHHSGRDGDPADEGAVRQDSGCEIHRRDGAGAWMR